MKLVASMIVSEVELDRYLTPCLDSLLEFCDEIVLLPDGHEVMWLADLIDLRYDPDRVIPVAGHDPVSFFGHEGRARNVLLDATLARNPTHVLAIDADEFIADGALLRQTIEAEPWTRVFPLCMVEVWEATLAEIRVRTDGGWRPHPIPCCYAAPPARRDSRWRIADRALACGREPQAVRDLARHEPPGAVTEILHFGWACRADRVDRYDRYRIADGGRFHANAHLESILWADPRVTLCDGPWPPALDPIRKKVVARAQRGTPEGRSDAPEKPAPGRRRRRAAPH